MQQVLGQLKNLYKSNDFVANVTAGPSSFNRYKLFLEELYNLFIKSLLKQWYCSKFTIKGFSLGNVEIYHV